MKVVAYLTHPLGPKLARDFTSRGDNIANAVDWVRWAIENTNWAINAAWLTHVMATDDELHLARALVDQAAQMVRCDALILVGGDISPHMRVEHEFAKSRGLPIVDATVLGRRPPVQHSRPPAPSRTWTDWLISRATQPVLPLVPR